MLLTLVDVISCENLKCRDFGKVISHSRGLKSYYCPVCGTVSRARMADADLANDLEGYRAYLRRTLICTEEPALT